MTPSFKSYAVREVHGGAIADSPSAMRKPKPLTYRGGWPLGAAGSDSNFSIQGRSLETTTRMPRVGSTAAPPQLAPPLLPGICTLPRKLGGVNNPSLRALRIMSRKRARSAALRYGLRSSTVNFWRENGGGFTGNGCVGDVFSPGTAVGGGRLGGLCQGEVGVGVFVSAEDGGRGAGPFLYRPKRFSGVSIKYPDK